MLSTLTNKEMIMETLATASSDKVLYPVTLGMGATIEQIMEAEERLGVVFPTDIVDFYLLTNGLSGIEDIFNILPVHELTCRRLADGIWVEFAEYMIFTESCGFMFDSNNINSYVFLRGSGYKDDTDDYRKLKSSDIVEFINAYSIGAAYEIWAD